MCWSLRDLGLSSTDFLVSELSDKFLLNIHSPMGNNKCQSNKHKKQCRLYRRLNITFGVLKVFVHIIK